MTTTLGQPETMNEARDIRTAEAKGCSSAPIGSVCVNSTLRADGVVKARPAYQRARGGEIPASALHFRTATADDAAMLVKTYHYSERTPGNVQFVGTLHTAGGLFGDYGEAVAAIFFSVPPTRWSEDVLELSRLVRKEGVRVPLTLLIRLACGKLKASGRDLLVSFADAGEGHHGGIYQAAGWNYGGQRDRACDGVIIAGKFVPGRSRNSTWGTRSPEKLTALLKQDVQPHYDVGKHLYWRALTKSGEAKAARLELKRLAYPKPSTQNND